MHQPMSEINWKEGWIRRARQIDLEETFNDLPINRETVGCNGSHLIAKPDMGDRPPPIIEGEHHVGGVDDIRNTATGDTGSGDYH